MAQDILSDFPTPTHHGLPLPGSGALVGSKGKPTSEASSPFILSNTCYFSCGLYNPEELEGSWLPCLSLPPVPRHFYPSTSPIFPIIITRQTFLHILTIITPQTSLHIPVITPKVCPRIPCHYYASDPPFP